jgi:hypothetical protein
MNNFGNSKLDAIRTQRKLRKMALKQKIKTIKVSPFGNIYKSEDYQQEMRFFLEQ